MEATEDMKKTWKIIKNIISRNKQNSPTESFVDNGKTITDKNAIVQKFNDFFVNIGPTLASKIQPTQSCTTLDPTRGSGWVGSGQKICRKRRVGSGPVRPEAKI